MKVLLVSAILGLGLGAVASQASATACAAGVYRAGCVGPNGAVVAHKDPPRPAVACGSGPYRAGCVGPNGAVVTHHAPQCAWVNGARVCR
jgi:hypothetical protein